MKIKLNTVEEKLNANNVIYLNENEYGTDEETFSLTGKFQKEYEFLLDAMIKKIEKDLNVDWVHDTNLFISFFEVHEDSEWYAVIHNINTQEDDIVKIKDVLSGTKYLDVLGKENYLYVEE